MRDGEVGFDVGFFDVGGAKFLSFLQPVAEDGERREGGGEIMAPLILLVHVCPEVDEIWEVFPGEGALKGRGFCGFGGKVRVREGLNGSKKTD